MNIDYNKEDLDTYINIQKLTYKTIGELYGVSGNAIKKAAKRLGVSIPVRRVTNLEESFNKGVILIPREKAICKNCNEIFTKYKSSHNVYCCKQCQLEYRHKIAYQKIIDGNKSIMRANYSPSIFREDILKEQDNKCAICGVSPLWNNKELVFIVDHIDGNAANNKRDNLRCICPNCDSQLDTYKSKNKNSARNYYRYQNIKKDNK